MSHKKDFTQFPCGAKRYSTKRQNAFVFSSLFYRNLDYTGREC